MIIPSIDLQGGSTVQLVGGEKKVLDAGDPLPIAEKFGVVGEIATIDLDAAMGTGSNAHLIEKLISVARCRVGGGIRNYETAKRWLDAGACKIIIGTAAQLDLLRQLPKARLIASLDTKHGEIVVNGWKTRTGLGIEERMRELRDHVGGFLVTFVEREGRLEGIDLNRVKELVAMAWPAQLTVAGGVTTAQDVADIHKMGADAQVGMALYTGRFDLTDSVAACLTSDRADGLWPTVVVDEAGMALGLAYSDRESLRYAIDHRCGAYHSRSRGGLWIKGATSGAMQTLLAVDMDCDADTLRFTVLQGDPGFCHENTWTCWGEKRGLHALVALLNERLKNAPDDSYTARLFREPALLRSKLEEEAGELADAALHNDIALETADVLFFAMVAMARGGVTLDEVERVLDRRSLRLTRRPGNAKSE